MRSRVAWFLLALSPIVAMFGCKSRPARQTGRDASQARATRAERRAAPRPLRRSQALCANDEHSSAAGRSDLGYRGRQGRWPNPSRRHRRHHRAADDSSLWK